MSKTAALAIFVKTPELSPVKTRLAASIGKETAIMVYENCLRIVETKVLNLQERLAPQIHLTPFWAVAETAAFQSPRWTHLQKIHQGDKPQLGDKLNHVYSNLKSCHNIVAVMGSDSPLFNEDEIEAGILSLLEDENSACIGPTEDGGYYFFASNTVIPDHCWKNVSYSEETTRAEFLNGLPEKLLVKSLALHWDIDNIDDLERASRQDSSFLIEMLRRS